MVTNEILESSAEIIMVEVERLVDKILGMQCPNLIHSQALPSRNRSS
jgi:hypothetical protein